MTADVCAGDHHVVSVYQSGHCDCGAWTWDAVAAPEGTEQPLYGDPEAELGLRGF
jgi:hypothetical protein